MQYQYQIKLYLNFIKIKLLFVRTTDTEHWKLCDRNNLHPPLATRPNLQYRKKDSNSKIKRFSQKNQKEKVPKDVVTDREREREFKTEHNLEIKQLFWLIYQKDCFSRFNDIYRDEAETDTFDIWLEPLGPVTY